MELSSDFIRENEHFLKSCILYEVLQKKQIIKSYEDFCDTVGEEAMNFKNFELWFWRFYHGCRDFYYDLSADQEPKTLVDVRVVSMYYILYEVLQKKSIFDSYRTFYDAVGKDTMDYPDFEFWYYRFYHGDMDFDYDRSIDPVPKTIMDMPVKLMYKITENLDPVERAYLRSMNRPIKDVTDSHPPIFGKIEICVSDDCLSWYLEDKMFYCYKGENGCTRFTIDKETKSDESFMKKGLEYLTPVLKMPNIQVRHLSLKLLDGHQTPEDLFPAPFHVKSVELYAFNISQSFPFLSALNPGELESIDLKTTWAVERHIALRFLETEHFKQAKSVQLQGRLNVEDLVRFSHLKAFECELEFRVPVNFQRIRDIISTFEQLESCELKILSTPEFKVGPIGEALGAEIPFGPLLPDGRMTLTHRYQIPESNEYLEFELGDKLCWTYIKIVKIR
ncbi:hypothetical protein B9Z55_026921 [Caenorhabditis nigoni]|uniref:F-box domain-containing protein n=1 Tax=Caenorhabditis nigoni TaxID=1611254 RepID=A0A2G5SI11_9PELO|nr:hypothetical protein B9Z55_026921 [Caenorhabditis nigoni]